MNTEKFTPGPWKNTIPKDSDKNMKKILEAHNGNLLVKGTHLTDAQKADLRFRGMSNPEWVNCHSFWFKDGRPSNEDGYIYPVATSLNFLPY